MFFTWFRQVITWFLRLNGVFAQCHRAKGVGKTSGKEGWSEFMGLLFFLLHFFSSPLNSIVCLMPICKLRLQKQITCL